MSLELREGGTAVVRDGREAIPDDPRSGGGTVLILGNYRPALTIARKLKRLGFQVAVDSNKQQPLLEYSRAVSVIWDAPPPSDKGFINELLSFIDSRGDVVAVIPCSEPMVDLVAENWKTLAGRNVRLATPAPAIVHRCHDKTGLLDLAKTAGLECPPYAVAPDAAALSATAETVGFPLVIRPLTPGSRFGTLKAITVASHDELAAYPAAIFEAAGPTLLQRHFSGCRFNVYFAALNGRIIDEQHVCILRSDRVDGSGLAVDGMTVDDVPELSRDVHRLCEVLDYTGVGCAQFLFDETTRSRCFLEINPRLGANFALVEAAGMPLTESCLQLSGVGAGVSGPIRRAKKKVRFAWTYGDLAGLWHAVTHRNVGIGSAFGWLAQAVRTALTADIHITWAKEDPKPTIMTYAGRLMHWMDPRLRQSRRILKQTRVNGALLKARAGYRP